jgi:hypothetical protein
MQTTLRLGLFAFVVWLSAGCDCAGVPARPNACAVQPAPMGCGDLCSPAVPCPAGTHCSANHCAAECGAGHPCPGGAPCSSDGVCLDQDASSGGRDGSLPPTDAPGPDHTCASVELGTMRATPNVIVIVDESGSMGTNDFPPGSGTSRWDALESALMANPDGLIFSLQSSVRWGMAWFHGGSGCPDNVQTVDCALNNYTAIDTRYMMLSPSGATPTGESIDVIMSRRATLIDDPSQPTIFILATDGDPNTCADRMDTVGGQMHSVQAVTDAFAAGIPTYVISVGTDAMTANLQAVANAGVGRTAPPDAPFWLATDTATLSDALTTIVGGVVSCNITLMGTIDVTQACSGTVTLAGNPLTCGDPNGWHAVDATHIQLDGDACTMLLAGAVPLRATFPCGVVIP